MNKLIPSNIQTDHFTSHAALLPVYERLFAPIKDTTNSILEIGTNDGGGIKMYSDYFIHAECFGMDILPTRELLLRESRIKHLKRDAYTVDSVESMRQLGGKFALIVDDGPHTLSTQIWFCKYYPHLLSADGLAIVEDIQDEKFLKPLFGAVPPGYYSMAIDQRHINNRFDDLILVIWPEAIK
jgi:cephalosporin hydroxylase